MTEIGSCRWGRAHEIQGCMWVTNHQKIPHTTRQRCQCCLSVQTKLSGSWQRQDRGLEEIIGQDLRWSWQRFGRGGQGRIWGIPGRGLEEVVSRIMSRHRPACDLWSDSWNQRCRGCLHVAVGVCLCVCLNTGLRCWAVVGSVSDWCNGYAISVLVFETQTSKDLHSVWRGFYNEPQEALLIRRALLYRIAFWCWWALSFFCDAFWKICIFVQYILLPFGEYFVCGCWIMDWKSANVLGDWRIGTTRDSWAPLNNRTWHTNDVLIGWDDVPALMPERLFAVRAQSGLPWRWHFRC